MSTNVVIFGGRFDPPHQGHRVVVEELSRSGQLVVMPSGVSSYKPCIATAQARLEMARTAFSDIAGVSSWEVDRAPEQSSYSFDTLLEWNRRTTSDQNLMFALGIDQFLHLPQWHRFPEVLEFASWHVIARRGAASLSAFYELLNHWTTQGWVKVEVPERVWHTSRRRRTLTWTETLAPEASSTQIREQLTLHPHERPSALAPGVFKYIQENHLYGT